MKKRICKIILIARQISRLNCYSICKEFIESYAKQLSKYQNIFIEHVIVLRENELLSKVDVCELLFDFSVKIK